MKKKRELVRLLSVTSVHQVYVGLACMLKNEDENTKYYDYLIINNSMLLDKTAASIRTVAKCHDFVNIIDVREYLKWFGTSLVNCEKSNIELINKLISLYNIISRPKRLKLLMHKLEETIPNNTIDEIYIRYKFNFPEVLLFSTFKSAGIHVFEDGLGDYIPHLYDDTLSKNNYNNRRFSIKRRVSKQSYKIISKKLHDIDMFYTRVIGMYALVDVNDGHRKLILKEKVNLEFENIKDYYLTILNIIENKLLPKDYNKPFVLLLPTKFSSRKLWYNDSIHFQIEDDINYTTDIVKTIKKQYPNCDIVIKTHPRTPEWLIDAFTNEFDSDYYCHVDSNSDIPSEILCNNKYFRALVAGFDSSTLLYSKVIFGKNSFFTRPYPEKINEILHPGDIKNREKTLIRFGVKELSLN